MPLLIMTGIPCSGKTKLTRELEQYFAVEAKKTVNIISEKDFIDQEKNIVYSDTQCEKVLRGKIKSATTRLINNNDLVVVDGLNYIKGYRYELYCIAKQHNTPHCVLQCITSIESAWKWNELRDKAEKYSKEVFDALIMRYEAPDGRNRWDSPLLTVLEDNWEIPFLPLFKALFERLPPPPNQSTQLQPLSSDNFLHALDKCTQEVILAILEIQKSVPEGTINIPNTSETLTLPRQLNLAELARIKRQFINYTQSHPVHDECKIRKLFVQYVNKTINLD